MRLVSLVFVAVSILLGVVLFQVKYRVSHLEGQLQALEKKILEHRETIKVYQAEWSYLTQPERLQKLTEQFLPLKPLLHNQVVALEDVMQVVDEENLVQAVLQGHVVSGGGS